MSLHLEEPIVLIDDLDGAEAFYRDELGFEVRHEGGDWLRVLEKDGRILVLRSNQSMRLEFGDFGKGERMCLTFRSDGLAEDHAWVHSMGLSATVLEPSPEDRGAFLFRSQDGALAFVYKLD